MNKQVEKRTGLTRQRVLISALAAVLTVTAGVQASPDAGPLKPERMHVQSSRYITRLLTDYHYLRPKLNDELSAKVFERFLEMLDGSRSYLLQSDIDQISKYRTQLDDALARGDLSVAYEIFAVFQKRWAERYDYALALAAKPMSFDGNDQFAFDREKAPWPRDMNEMNALWAARVKNDALNLKLANKKPEEIRDLLTKRYEAAKRRMTQTNSEDVFSYYMNALTAAIEPHTSYFSPPQAENFDIEMRLSLEGIGAVLQSDDVYTKVARLIEAGPADKSKQIFPEDKVLAVGQENGPMIDVVGWRLDDVVDLIRGKAGTTVRLEILPHKAGADGASKTITLLRDKVKLEEQAAKSSVLPIEGNGQRYNIGVINVPKFYVDFQARAMGDKNYKSVARDVRDLVQKLKAENVDGIILDLRNNGGGGLDEATQMSGLFIDKGPVVQERTQTGQVSVLVDEEPGVVWGGPLVVLVNGQSASASEIVAAALQDYGRALVIGEPTFGKGTVQTVFDLNRLRDGSDFMYGQVKYTVHKFYRVSGQSTQHRGVLPDITLPTLWEQSEFGEGALPNAMAWDYIPATHYTPVGNLQRFVPQLKTLQEKRVKNATEYQYLLEDLAEYKARKADTTVSLNEAQRRAERDKWDQKQLARENARRKLKGLEPLKALPDAPDVEDADKDAPDARLTESAHVLADLIWLQNGQRVVDAGDRKPADAARVR